MVFMVYLVGFRLMVLLDPLPGALERPCRASFTPYKRRSRPDSIMEEAIILRTRLSARPIAHRRGNTMCMKWGEKG